MRNRTLFLVAALLAVALAAVPAGAEEGTVDRATRQPTDVAVTEGQQVANESQKSSIVRAFHEAWESAGTVEASGWAQEYVQRPDDAPSDPFRRVHRTEDSPVDAPKASPIAAESRPHAVTVMTDEGTYPAGLDARLISPVLDLRYVRGNSQSTTAVHDNESARQLLLDLQQEYNEGFTGESRFTSRYDYLLASPPSDWFPVPCSPQNQNYCDRARQGLYQQDETRSGREAYESDTRSSTVIVGPIDFFGNTLVPQQAETVTVPASGTRDLGLYTDDQARIHAPNPVDRREGMSYINLTFWHKWDLWQHPGGHDAAYLEVRERRSDGSWSEWRHLEPDEVWNQPAADPSSEHHEATSDHRTMAYNGWDEDKRAFVGSSDGLVASTFNLNRFAGTEIQIAWRFSASERSRPELGWFIDDVVLWTNTYDRDVGIREVLRPEEGDRLAPGEPARPSAIVRNYGHHPMEDVQVTFRVTPADDTNETLWSDSQPIDVLGPQEELEVAATEPLRPGEDLPGDGAGTYRLVANVTPYATPDPEDSDLTRQPETAPSDDNDERRLPFQVQSKPSAHVRVDLDEGSVQSDVGEPKTFTVEMENTGNVPLTGTVEVTATRLDRSTLEPAGESHIIDRLHVRPGEFPFGTALNAFGSDGNTWEQPLEWDEGLDTAGIYRIGATFDTGPRTFDGRARTYVRATPAPYFDEAADSLLNVSFHPDSVYSAGMTVEGWTAEAGSSEISAAPTLPDPVSPNHVWFGRGDDGGLGTAAYGESAEGTAGTDQDLNDTYRETEPDERCRGPGESRANCRETRDPNFVDHYWLTRDVNLTAYDDADEILLAFWHTGEFNWSGDGARGQDDASRSRGRVEILPQRNAILSDPDGFGSGPLSDGPEAESGVEQVDRRTPSEDENVTLVGSDVVFAQTLASYESPVPWKRDVIDLTPWKGEKVTLRFHLETTARRLKVNSSSTQDEFAPAPAGPGQLPPWLLDDVEVTAKEDGRDETVLSSDLEGEDWRRWSSASGVRFEDPRAPAAVAEGRGWERFDYGVDKFPTGWFISTTRERPEAGTLETSPMFRWGDPLAVTEDRLPTDVNLSILKTPEFRLEGTRSPTLTFLTNYTLPSDPTKHPELLSNDPFLTTGASVWVVGEDSENREVKRELLTPTDESEAQYDGFIYTWNSKPPRTCNPEAYRNDVGRSTQTYNQLHCNTPLAGYPNRTELVRNPNYDDPGGNVLTGRSGQDAGDAGPSEWVRAEFDLSRYASNGNDSLDYHLEFHGINQRTDGTKGIGWLVDDVKVTEDTFANDMGVDAIVRPETDVVGPGLQVPTALRLQNEGLYSQVGAEVSYTVRTPSGEVVFGPVTQQTDPGIVIPGARNTANPDKNHTVVFNQPWTTPLEEGTYVIEGTVNLSGAPPGHAFPDANPANDLLRREVEVEARRSVGIQSARVVPDESVVDPFKGSTDSFRSFRVPVKNDGTLPEDATPEGPGNFTLNVTVDSCEVFCTEKKVATGTDLQPGEVRNVTFENAWRPETTGVYEVTFRLHHPNETVDQAQRDNDRSITYVVLDGILPRPDEDLASMFESGDRGWTRGNDTWRFGRGGSYHAGADDVLTLKDPVSVRKLRQAVIRLNHSYAFERGYDGGLLEAKPVDGDTWYPVPPRADEGSGYPVEMTAASPFVEEPDGSAAALSGTSGPAENPETVETVFDLAAVDPLVTESSIFEDPMESGFGETESVRRGDWSHEYLSRVEPHSGDVMFHSNLTAMQEDCWRTTTEDSGDRDNLPCTRERTDPVTSLYDSRKNLGVTFDDEFAEARDTVPLDERVSRSDVDSLQVIFWDYRAFAPEQYPSDSVEQTTLAETPNEVSVHLECVGEGCPDGATLQLDPVEPGSYDDNYRGWTKNVFEVKAANLNPFIGPDRDIRLRFTHHVFTHEHLRLRSTDYYSAHAGWFLDDVSLRILERSGEVDTYWSDDLEGHVGTYEREGGEWREVLDIVPWNGTSWTYKHGVGSFTWPRTLWDPASSWGEPLWRHVQGGMATAQAEPGTPPESGPDDGGGADRSFVSRIASEAGPVYVLLSDRDASDTDPSETRLGDADVYDHLVLSTNAGPWNETADGTLTDGVVAPGNDEWIPYDTDTPASENSVQRVGPSNLDVGPHVSTRSLDAVEFAGGELRVPWFDSTPAGHDPPDAPDVGAAEPPCGPLANGADEMASGFTTEGDYVGNYTATTDHFRACGPTSGQQDRAGGDRLVTDLNLRPAVGNVTLSFDHKHRFRFLTNQFEPLIEGRSAGRVEVSLDGGETWIPLEPSPDSPSSSHYPVESGGGDPEDASHTTLGGRRGDPESNSIYGIGGSGFTGVSGEGPEDGPESETAKYDLSPFAGRKIKIAWHASFGSHTTGRYPDGTKMGYEFWAVDNVSVDADVLDPGPLDLRLRAASDGSKGDQGWTVNGLEMIGTSSTVNAGAEIVDLQSTTPSGDTSFGVVLANKGELPVPVDATVTVEATGGDGSVGVNASTSDPIRLPPQGQVELRSLGGENLSATLEAGKTYRVEASVTVADEDLREAEAVRGDNRDTVVVDDVRGDSDLVVESLQAQPNHVSPRPGEPVRIEGVVQNDGFKRPTVDMENLTLLFARSETGEDVHSLSGPEDLEVNPGDRFRAPFQEKTFVWKLGASEVREALGPGTYDVTLEVRERGDAELSTGEDVLHVGSSYFHERAFWEPVANGTFNDEDHENCRFQPDPQGGQGPSQTPPSSWEVDISNHTKWRSYGTNQARGTLVCDITDQGPVREDLHLTFYTRYRFTGDSYFNVTFRKDPQNTQCDPTAGEMEEVLVDDADPKTPRFGDHAYVPRTIPIPGSVDDGPCVGFGVDGSPTGVNVDDIVLSPYAVDLTPRQDTIPVTDNTVKRYPITVTNEGAFNDTYRFRFVDPTGRPPDTPRSWDLAVETPDGEPVESVDLAAGESRTFELVVDIPVQGAASRAGSTSAAVTAVSETSGLVRATASFDFRFDYAARPDLEIVDAAVNKPDLEAGRPRSVTVTVANVGVEPAEGVPLSITDRMPPRFGEPPRNLTQINGDPLPKLSLAPGQAQTIIAGWTPTEPGPHNLTVHVDSLDEVVEPDEENNVDLLEVPVESAKFPDLQVTLETSEDEPEAGSEIAVNASITNAGSAPAQGVRTTLRVGVRDLLEGDPPHILPTVLEPGETVRLSGTWPASFPGEYRAFAKAIPLSGALEPAGTQDDNLAVEGVTVRSPSLQVDAPEAAVNASQGAEVTVPLTIENAGDSNETADVTARAPDGLRARTIQDGVSVTRVDVPAGGNTSLALRVRTPSQAVAGTYPVTVTAVSTETGQTESVTVPVRIEADHGLSLEASAAEVDPGGGTIPIRVGNTGNVPASVNVTARDLPAGWSLDADATLDPFSEREVDGVLEVPTDAAAGVRDLTVVATSGEATAEAPVRVTVGTRGVLDVTLEPGSVAIRPGSRVTFNATLDSVGNVPAFPDLRVEAPGSWTADLPQPRARIPDGESLAFNVPVAIPDDAGQGTHEVRLVADGEEETFAENATVRVGIPDPAVTNVEQNPRVNVEAGEDVTFTATVRNPGGLAVDEAGVGMYVDDALTDFGTVEEVAAAGATELTLDWTAEPGEHVILLVADPGEKIKEDDEGNNARLLVVQVGGDAQVFGDVERAVPGTAALGLVALLAGAVGRRWRS